MKKLYTLLLAIIMFCSLSLPTAATTISDEDMPSSNETNAVISPNEVSDDTIVYDVNSEQLVYDAAWFKTMRSGAYSGYESHYTTNTALEGSSMGYIYGQANCPNFYIGLTSRMADVGCGIAAIYNALKYQGVRVTASDIIYSFEKNGYIMTYGYLGTDPYAIGEYLTSSYINYTQYTDFTDMEAAIEDGIATRQTYIISSWNGSSVADGLHTYALYTTTSGEGVYVYNLYNSDTAVRFYESIDFFVDEQTFVVGYVIPQIRARSEVAYAKDQK